MPVLLSASFTEAMCLIALLMCKSAFCDSFDDQNEGIANRLQVHATQVSSLQTSIL